MNITWKKGPRENQQRALGGDFEAVITRFIEGWNAEVRCAFKNQVLFKATKQYMTHTDAQTTAINWMSARNFNLNDSGRQPEYRCLRMPSDFNAAVDFVPWSITRRTWSGPAMLPTTYEIAHALYEEEAQRIVKALNHDPDYMAEPLAFKSHEEQIGFHTLNATLKANGFMLLYDPHNTTYIVQSDNGELFQKSKTLAEIDRESYIRPLDNQED